MRPGLVCASGLTREIVRFLVDPLSSRASPLTSKIVCRFLKKSRVFWGALWHNGLNLHNIIVAGDLEEYI